MKKIHKLQFISLIIILFGALSYKTYEQYINIHNTQKLLILNNSESLATFIEAFRSTYQDRFIQNHIEITDKTMKLLPVQTISEISQRFSSSVNGDIIIRTVSDRPRNPDNMANDFELEMIKFYKKTKTLESQFVEKEDGYYYTKALYITPLCMKCHGKREDAVPSIRDKYEEAYDYKLGDVRGLISIEIKQKEYFSGLYDDLKENLMITILMFLILSVFIYLLIRKISSMEDEHIQKNKKQQELLFEQSRMAQMGELISMIAHQWRQPLGAIAATSLDLNLKLELENFDIQTQEGRDEARDYFLSSLKNIDALVQNLTITIDDFRNFYKPNKQKQQSLLHVPMQKAYTILKSTLSNVEIIEKYDSKEILELHENEFMQVLINIVKNANDNFILKSTQNASITISTWDTQVSSIMSICDNGGGIDPLILAKIFDPYFSTKSEKNGTGLGLYMSKIIIQEHHQGKLSAQNTSDGVCFTIELFKKDVANAN